jgi:hypothetical protein
MPNKFKLGDKVWVVPDVTMTQYVRNRINGVLFEVVGIKDQIIVDKCTLEYFQHHASGFDWPNSSVFLVLKTLNVPKDQMKWCQVSEKHLSNVISARNALQRLKERYGKKKV